MWHAMMKGEHGEGKGGLVVYSSTSSVLYEVPHNCVESCEYFLAMAVGTRRQARPAIVSVSPAVPR